MPNETTSPELKPLEPSSNGDSRMPMYEMPKYDVVNHPKHYTQHPSGVECITITEHMTFNLGNAVKYIWQGGDKGNLLQDLKKARWYIDREIARLEK